MVAKQISEAEAQHEQEVELGSCSYSVSKLVAPCQPYPHSCLVSTCVGVVVVTLPQRMRKGVLFLHSAVDGRTCSARPSWKGSSSGEKGRTRIYRKRKLGEGQTHVSPWQTSSFYPRQLHPMVITFWHSSPFYLRRSRQVYKSSVVILFLP